MGLEELEEIGRTAQQISRGQIPTTISNPSLSNYKESVQRTTDGDVNLEETVSETEEDLQAMREKSAQLAWGVQSTSISDNESIS